MTRWHFAVTKLIVTRIAGRRVRQNIRGRKSNLWKKVQRNELMHDKRFAARLLQGAEIELPPMRLLNPQRKYRSKLTIPLMTACISPWLSRKNASLL